VVYEKWRVYVQYVVWYKSNQPVPELPPVPKTCRRPGFTSHRLRRTPSSGTDDAERPSSDDERISDSNDDDDDDDDDAGNCARRRSTLRRSSASPSRRCSSPENVACEHQDAMNDYYSSSTAQARDDSVTKVSVTRERTKTLLHARGQCLIFAIDNITTGITFTHYIDCFVT